MLRFILIWPVLGALVLSLATFEGASQTDDAFAIIEASLPLAPPLREAALAQASARLEQSWARPVLWNARAAEALSHIYALRAEASGQRALLAQSVIAARTALRLSPVQPQTWTRLAKLALLHAPGVPCTAQRCLELSWKAAPIADPATDCARLRLWVEAGLPVAQIRHRISTYARAEESLGAVEHCLSFLPPDERFQFLAMARSQQSAH